jgi:hypothetical protein
MALRGATLFALSPGEKLSDIVSMRLSPDDRKRLDRVASQVPIVPRLTLVRLAFRIGLEAIAQNPTRALRGVTFSGR